MSFRATSRNPLLGAPIIKGIHSMIYITHDQEEAFAMSDRIMVMKEAKIVQIDTPENIIANPADDYVREFVLSNLQSKIDSLMKYAGERA